MRPDKTDFFEETDETPSIIAIINKIKKLTSFIKFLLQKIKHVSTERDNLKEKNQILENYIADIFKNINPTDRLEKIKTIYNDRLEKVGKQEIKKNSNSTHIANTKNVRIISFANNENQNNTPGSQEKSQNQQVFNPS